MEGSWPGPITLTLGWSRARARPWNEVFTDPLVRLDRGNSAFLAAVCSRLEELGAAAVYSPALYPGSTRMWQRSGFGAFADLTVMEGDLGGFPVPPADDVSVVDSPDWDEIARIDRAAFDGFWGMSPLGLEEAHQANRASALLTSEEDGVTVGYAIVGAQWGVTYLHRIAVHPQSGGRGHGAKLLAAARRWGRAHGASNIVLNVRPQNAAARRFYERHGFVDTGSRIVVLRHPPGRLLN